ncbi:SLBB domain-containing protein [Geothrix edaphica]|uniref:Sugar ABC transporter substrate-binding protein n=1 Tax=Geothrix edaphica TaxID=2927976 RepID=A0ABQ5PTD2_9BACT|nr:SLBB domain-containing protein [Geothrix edaphica]GLH65687.1 sugar ABC transporter substrate-binding protein [Geothrix edaphica]
MRVPPLRHLLPLVATTALFAQLPQGLDLQALKQAASAQGVTGAADTVPTRTSALPATTVTPEESARQRSEDEKLDDEIRALKRREKGALRFGADLFQVRQRGSAATEGGIAEDYVLGTGDRLNLNVFGSATFDLPVQVDGRGEIVIPKVGTAKVGGLTLGKAKAAVQGLVSRNFSRSSVDLQVIKLREVRVFVLGEVYKPGSYLVSSLSSLVNVLGLAGGPTAVGSYRDIRVMRGGRQVAGLDLYPLRAEGLGNPNVALQNGDTLFVPLAQNQVWLEGAFQRVVSALAEPPKKGDLPSAEELALDPLKDQRDRIQREIKAIEAQLGPHAEPVLAQEDTGREGREASALHATQAPAVLSLTERANLEDRLYVLKRQLVALKEAPAGDHRVRLNPETNQPILLADADGTKPEWLRRWEQTGAAPRMQFELRADETAADALRFAGGFAPEAGPGTLTLRRLDASGVLSGQDVPLEAAARLPLQRGDVLSALPRRERTGPVVQISGWARVPGTFARTEGLKVGDLLRRDSQVLPDTYRARGEVVRTSMDGTTRFLAFDVDRALAGEPTHNVLLEDRDRVELFRLDELRLPRLVTVLGPVARPGTYRFHEGMRASDLIFRAGVPEKSADRLVAELARSKDGKPSEVIRLDLAKLLSTEAASPIALLDDTVNPRIQVDDQLSLFEKPDYKVHRAVRITGQVVRPGTYTLDSDHSRLSEVIRRAGGLTPEAMPQAGIFLRRMSTQDASLQRAAEESGLVGKDPTAKGINEILERLNETKRQPLTGQLLKNPLLHGLLSGSLNRMVVDFGGALKGDNLADVDLQDGDEIIIPRASEAAYVVGETASPFATYKVRKGMKVADLLKLAGGTTRNADTSNIRLLKADGRILDSWIDGKAVEPGDTVLVPQRFRRDSSWQENLQALTPLALILNAVK